MRDVLILAAGAAIVYASLGIVWEAARGTGVLRMTAVQRERLRTAGDVAFRLGVLAVLILLVSFTFHLVGGGQ